MSTKISCGGFYIDDETLSLSEDDKLSIKNSVPAVTASDKGKFLHVNSTTGNVEWAEGGGSGGGTEWLQVGISLNDQEEFVCNKTAGEILEASPFVLFIEESESDNGVTISYLSQHFEEDNTYTFTATNISSPSPLSFTASSLDDYPVGSLPK